MAQDRPRYQFGEFELDTPAATLRRGAQEIPLPPKAFQVLAYLIEHRRQVVSKQELVEALWKDTFVTDDALVQAITAVRKALGDDAESPRFIRTKPRVGYQFIAPLEAGDAERLEAAPVSVWEAPLARKRARTLMILIQFGYLGIYAALLLNLSIAADVLGSVLGHTLVADWSLPFLLLTLLALVGAAVRLYLITTVALDHPQTGRQYRRLAPALFALDLLTALTPLLLVHATGLAIALILIPVLAYSPFAQTTLMRTAYPAR